MACVAAIVPMFLWIAAALPSPRCKIRACGTGIGTGSASFEATFEGLVSDAVSAGGVYAALGGWIGRLDEDFIPELGARIIAAPADTPESSNMNTILQVLDEITAIISIYTPRVEQIAGDPRRQSLVGQLLTTHWRPSGEISEEESRLIASDGLPEGAAHSSASGSSTYGEVTHSGARELFAAMGLDGRSACAPPACAPPAIAPAASAPAAVFVDLGSGDGVLTAQAWLELGPDSPLRTLGRCPVQQHRP